MEFTLPIPINADRRNDFLNIELQASIVHNCVQDDKLSKLRTMMKKFNAKQREQIVNQRINGNAPLFTACFYGKVHFVNYILDECAADIEMKGVYEVEEDHSRHQVTPLWCAAVADKLEVVKSLVSHGANVNSPSDTDSTPVRSACYMTNIAVIKYLTDHGANIHKPNVNGGTCLINSVQSSELCEFLINRGADVNAKDNSGNLALHYAIREGRVEPVKLLLKHGSNHTVKNDFGDDALQTAALRGCHEILDIILKVTDPSTEDIIRGYELLGTNYVDEQNDMVSALSVWKKAMKLRYTDTESPFKKQLPEETNYVYCHFKEPETLTELEKMFDPEEIHMQTLLIRERILGPYHKDTTFALMYRGAVYADSHRYQRCVDLWKYAYTLRHKKCEPLHQECMFTIQALVKLFWEIQVEVEARATDETVQLSDVLEALEILAEQIASGCALLKTDKAESDSHNQVQLLLQLFLHMAHLASRIGPVSSKEDGSSVRVLPDETGGHKVTSRLVWQEADRTTFLRCVHKLVVLDPRGTSNETLLHLAVDPKISLTSEEFYSSFPSMSVIKILVHCGANVNAVCDKGNTPLYNAVKFLNFQDLQEEGILKFLLNSGTHVDISNKSGETALNAMEEKGLSICPLDYVSLRCLAAKVIVKHKLSFKDEIPVSLIPFVEMHAGCEKNE